MSRVVQTELFEGAVATAANFNNTLDSWNDATAAGEIGADNFREEGLDVRSFAVGAVKKTFASTDRFIGGALGGGSFSTTSAVFVPVVMAATTAQIGPFDLSQTNRRLVVHASLFARMVTPGAVVEVELAQSPDNITYTSISWTLRALRARVGNTPLVQADIEQSFTIATRITAISATTYIRLRARTSGGATGTINCVSLFGELYNK